MPTDPPSPDYAVGPGRPPMHSRFKKGQSGNPRGRPRGAENLTSQLLRALERRVAVAADGRGRKRSKREIGLDRIADQFAAGDPQAARLLFGLIADFERRLPPEPEVPPPLDESDRSVIANWLPRPGLR